MLKVGLIGCGFMGATHAAAWMKLSDRATLVAVADSNTARAEETVASARTRVYADAMEMLEKESLDVVDICLPTAYHADMLVKAMDYVQDIIVEKPLCLTAEEADMLVATQEEKGVRVQVAHVARFNPEYEYLAATKESGMYGRLLTAHFKRLSPPPLWMRGFDDEKVSGGMALDFHVHDVDFVRYLMGGDPDRLSSHGTVCESGDVHHLWSIYHYGDARLMTEASWYHPFFSLGFCVKFEKATLVLEGGTLTVYPKEGEPFTPPLRILTNDGVKPTMADKILYELSCFADAVIKNEPATVSLKEAAGAIRLAKREIAMIRENVK